MWSLLLLCVAGLLCLVAMAGLPASANAQCGGTPLANWTTHGKKSFSAPSGVSSVCVEVKGAQGGGSAGGRGGLVEGTFSVTPGQMLEAFVDGGGGEGGVGNGGGASAIWSGQTLFGVAGGGGGTGSKAGGGDAGPSGATGASPSGALGVGGHGGTAVGAGGDSGTNRVFTSGWCSNPGGAPGSGGGAGCGNWAAGGGGGVGAGGGSSGTVGGGSTDGGDAGSGTGKPNGGGTGGDGGSPGGGGGYVTPGGLRVFGGGGGSLGTCTGGGGGGYGGGGGGSPWSIGRCSTTPAAGGGGGGSNYIDSSATSPTNTTNPTAEGASVAVFTSSSTAAASAGLAPPNNDFGSIPVDETTDPHDFTVSNNGGSLLTIAGIATTGAAASDYSLDDSDCMGSEADQANGALAPGESCQVSATFTPSATGPRNATLAVTTDGGNPTSPLSGTGQPLTLKPLSKDFGQVQVGDTGQAQPFTVTNVGTQTVHMSAAQFNGANTNDFTKDDSDCLGAGGANGSLPAGESCTIEVAFKPTAGGSRQAGLSVTSDGGNPQSNLTGVGGGLTLTPSSADFGAVLQGHSSTPQVFTVANAADHTIHLSSPRITGPDADPFFDSDVDSSDCMGSGSGQANGVLGPGESCTVSLIFFTNYFPLVERHAALTIPSDGGTVSSQLQAIGVASSVVTITPSPYDFRQVQVGKASRPQRFTVTNTASERVVIASAQLSGLNSGDFSMNDSDCTSRGGSLSPGGSCVVTATFSPKATGAPRKATLTFNSDGGNATSQLQGTGISTSGPLVVPTLLDLGSVRLGSSSSPHTITVTNNGPGTATLSSIKLTGANPGDFSKDDSDCMGPSGANGSLPVGSSCAVKVKFAPVNLQSVGERSASVEVASDKGTTTSQLSGTGLSDLELAPASVDFGTVQNTQSGAPVVFTLTNRAMKTVQLSSTYYTGPDIFTKDDTNCTGNGQGEANNTLAPGASCTISVTFSPEGFRPVTLSGTLSVASDHGSPQSALSGTVSVDPVAGVQASPTSLDVGSVEIGRTSDAQTITITNHESAAATISGTQLSGPNLSDFTKDDSDCLAGGGTLAAGASCQVEVTFSPPAAGAADATLTVSSDSGNPTTQLSGTGIPGIELAPASLDFGSVAIGQAGTTQTVDVVNLATETVRLSQTTLAGPDPNAFTKDDSDCLGDGPGQADGTLAPGEYCGVDLTLKPSSFGAKAATLTVESNSGNPTSGLSGNAIVP